MATRLYSRNTVLLAKMETTEATDSVPTGAANAILCTQLSIEPLAGQAVDLAYVRPYFGKSPSMRVEDYMVINLTVDFAGTATAGTAAPWGPLLRACGMQETLTAAAITGSAQAGSTTTLTLAAGASATDNIYNGADLVITSGTGSGQTRNIIAYNGTTKVATVDRVFSPAPAAASGYSISPNATYLPISTAFESVTLYYNINGTRHKALGVRGNCSFDLSSNQRPVLKFTLTGIYGGVADAAETGVVFTSWQVPVPVNSNNSAALINSKVTDGSATGIQLMNFTLDLVNTVKHRMLVGSENVVLTDRQAAGTVSMEMTNITFNDWFSQIRAANKAPLYIENGTASGNTVAVFLPNAQLADPKYADSEGVVMLDMSILAIPLIGNDEVRVVVK